MYDYENLKKILKFLFIAKNTKFSYIIKLTHTTHKIHYKTLDGGL